MNWLRWLFEGERHHETDYLVKRFVPQTDITAYETAYLLSKMPPMLGPPSRGVAFTQRKWDELEPQYKRHFQDGE